MRVMPILLSCLLVFGTSGCMVLDEVDAANAKMAQRSTKKGDEVAEGNASASSPESKSSALLEQSKQWWESARSITSSGSDGSDASIVHCRLPEGTHFMSRDDCLTQGGVPERRSG